MHHLYDVHVLGIVRCTVKIMHVSQLCMRYNYIYADVNNLGPLNRKLGNYIVCQGPLIGVKVY